MPSFSALTSDALEEEECFSELVHLQREGLGAFDTVFPTAQGRGKKLVTEDWKPAGSGRFREQTRDAQAVPGLVLSLLIQDLPPSVSLLCREVNSRHCMDDPHRGSPQLVMILVLYNSCAQAKGAPKAE